MSKDGTVRGGSRAGAGRKKKPLADSIRDDTQAVVMRKDPVAEANSTKPDFHNFRQMEQANGDALIFDEVAGMVWDWLKEKKCATIVPAQLIEQYAMNYARWIHCERAVSQEGYTCENTRLGIHQNPNVKTALEYSRHANQIWAQIYQIVKENCSEAFSEKSAISEEAEALFRTMGL